MTGPPWNRPRQEMNPAPDKHDTSHFNIQEFHILHFVSLVYFICLDSINVWSFVHFWCLRCLVKCADSKFILYLGFMKMKLVEIGLKK